MTSFIERIGIKLPIIQAPMAGTSTPALASAVSNAGGLGSIALGAADAENGRAMIKATRALTDRPFNVNLFCHAPAIRDPACETAWLAALEPEFRRFGAKPPEGLREIYRSFVEDNDMLAMLIEEKPKLISFHFGLPPAERIACLHAEGATLIATATSLPEALQAVAAGIDAVVAQGYEAGGHRGIFDPDGPDDQLSTFALVGLFARELSVPVIAAGGIMTGAGIAASLMLGASAAQLGTAFIGCPESQADDAYRAALFSDAASHTLVTKAISGRPARCLSNGFTAIGLSLLSPRPPAYPIAYDAGKSLNAAAKAANNNSYGAQWAGQGAPLARAMPATELMAVLKLEMDAAMASLN